MSEPHASPRKTEKAEEKAREHDPDGTAPADEAAKGQPAGAPTSDRHDTETAIGEAGGDPGQGQGG